MDWAELRRLLDSFDGRWELAVLANLETGAMRPSDLREAINTQTDGHDQSLAAPVLNATLKRMRRDKLLHRQTLSRFPRITLYSLTPWAYELIATLDGLEAWYTARQRCQDHRSTTTPTPTDPNGQPDTENPITPPQG